MSLNHNKLNGTLLSGLCNLMNVVILYVLYSLVSYLAYVQYSTGFFTILGLRRLKRNEFTGGEEMHSLSRCDSAYCVL